MSSYEKYLEHSQHSQQSQHPQHSSHMPSFSQTNPSQRPPISPTPSRPNFKIVDGFIVSEQRPVCPTSPIPRSTPIGVWIDNYNSKYLQDLPSTLKINDYGEDESVISEERSSSWHTPDSKDDRESRTRIASPSDLAFFSYLNELKSTLPLLTHETVSSCNVLSQYFANEIFHSNNFINICQGFYNNDFESFPYNRIFNPYIPQDKSYHSRIINILKKLYKMTHELICHISIFNSLIDKVNLFDVSFTNLLTIKQQFNYLINNYLIEEIEEIVKQIKPEIYKYNLIIEEIQEQQEHQQQQQQQQLTSDNIILEEFQDNLAMITIENLRNKIESILMLKTNKLTRTGLQNFYEVLITGVIENAEWCNFIEKLRDMV